MHRNNLHPNINFGRSLGIGSTLAAVGAFAFLANNIISTSNKSSDTIRVASENPVEQVEWNKLFDQGRGNIYSKAGWDIYITDFPNIYLGYERKGGKLIKFLFHDDLTKLPIEEIIKDTIAVGINKTP